MKKRPDRESGFTLVLGLIFMLVASMSAVTLMRGSAMQEQMTANMNHKAISFMAAEAGANELLRKLPSNEAEASFESGFGGNGRYKTVVKEFIANKFTVDVTGEAVSGSQVLAATTIQIVFALPSPGLSEDDPSSDGLNLPSAITFGGNVKTFTPANSNKFSKNNPGLIITVQNQNDFELVDGGVAGSNNMRETTSVVKAELDSPWNDAEKLTEFIDGLRGNDKVNFIDATIKADERRLDAERPITVIEDGVSLNGNQGKYEGVVIFLGEKADFNGLGSSDIKGAIYAANPAWKKRADGSYGYDFGEMSVAIHGGGNGTLIYDRQAGASALPPPDPKPDPDSKAAIISWRETITDN